MKQALLFTGKKLLRAALLLLGVSLAAFLLLCASPLDPLQTNVGQVALGSMSPEQVANLEAYWGVDQPPAQRRPAAGQLPVAAVDRLGALRRAGAGLGIGGGGLPGPLAG